jgi:hypothetical protein
MKEEIALVRRIRARICPELHRRAEGANANASTADTITVPGKAAPFDYEAFIACRQKAEAVLESSHRVLFRNRLGFTYYTPSGADLARRAEQASEELHGLGCWPGTGQL